MLGHRIAFSYCRHPGNDGLCRHIVNCWFERFDVQDYLSDYYSDEEIAATMKPPTPKLASLVSLIESARGAAVDKASD